MSSPIRGDLTSGPIVGSNQGEAESASVGHLDGGHTVTTSSADTNLSTESTTVSTLGETVIEGLSGSLENIQNTAREESIYENVLIGDEGEHIYEEISFDQVVSEGEVISRELEVTLQEVFEGVNGVIEGPLSQAAEAATRAGGASSLGKNILDSAKEAVGKFKELCQKWVSRMSVGKRDGGGDASRRSSVASKYSEGHSNIDVLGQYLISPGESKLSWPPGFEQAAKYWGMKGQSTESGSRGFIRAPSSEEEGIYETPDAVNQGGEEDVAMVDDQWGDNEWDTTVYENIAPEEGIYETPDAVNQGGEEDVAMVDDEWGDDEWDNTIYENVAPEDTSALAHDHSYAAEEPEGVPRREESVNRYHSVWSVGHFSLVRQHLQGLVSRGDAIDRILTDIESTPGGVSDEVVSDLELVVSQLQNLRASLEIRLNEKLGFASDA